MIKKETKEIEFAKHCCDICEKEFNPYYQQSGTKCLVCERDLCEKHRKIIESGIFGCSIYCPSCWKTGRKYFTQLRILKRKFHNDFEKIEEAMKKECLKALEK